MISKVPKLVKLPASEFLGVFSCFSQLPLEAKPGDIASIIHNGDYMFTGCEWQRLSCSPEPLSILPNKSIKHTHCPCCGAPVIHSQTYCPWCDIPYP